MTLIPITAGTVVDVDCRLWPMLLRVLGQSFKTLDRIAFFAHRWSNSSPSRHTKNEFVKTSSIHG
jgi:hypothetical protein